jgi:hypothetical protein
MKETTKPKNTKQSHLLKRDLAENIAVLPLPTPPAGARGEGSRSGAASECSSRREEAPFDYPQFELSPIDLQFPQFLDIAVRRDEPLSLSPINEQILTLTTDNRLPNV